ncbi:MAG TPA: type III pantothenate kinase, partial [Bacteroidetes bacterium]|nr:type III pantothenate kinase [Bacteroidota bacterium]
MSETTLLALDIGNTNVVLGIFTGEELRIRRRLATRSGRTADEAGVLVTMLCRDGGVEPEEIDAVAIASVTPKIGAVYGEMAQTYLGCEPYFIHGEIPGFINKYRNPSAVGADRVCDAVAGYRKYGGPLLILDFGTAVTLDVIDHDGAYLGGVILPGLETSSETLHRVAALLPSVRLSMPERTIGKTTEESIRIGLMKGAVHAIRGLIAEARAELGAPEAVVIATGGLAPVLLPH